LRETTRVEKRSTDDHGVKVMVGWRLLTQAQWTASAL
jgi:hypothetical protein